MAGAPLKPSTMIDANVLIYAARMPRKEDNESLRDLVRVSKEFVAQLPMVRMASVSVAEVFRRLTATERAELAARNVDVDGIFAEPLTGDMARLAAELVNRRTPSRDMVCRKCQNILPHNDQKPCQECGAKISPHQRLDDAFIVATAALTKGVEFLASADDGVVELGRVLHLPEIKKLFPAVTGLRVGPVALDFGPMFSETERHAGVPVAVKKASRRR